MRKLTLLFLLISLSGMGQVLIDSYSEIYKDTHYSLSASGNTCVAQSFANTNTITLNSAKFYLAKEGTPTGNLYAYIYAHTGVYGTGGPTGSALATSNAVDITSISGTLEFALITFTFSGANKISLSENTKYCVGVSFTGGDASNKLDVAYDASTPTAGGTYSRGNCSTWSNKTYDLAFYVYGDGVVQNVSPFFFIQF